MAGLLERAIIKALEKRAEHIKLPGWNGKVKREGHNKNTALTLSAVWAAVGLIAGHMASVPLNLYRRLPGGGKEKATDNPLWRTLHDEPYPGISSYEFREALYGNIELYGVGFVQVTYNRERINLLPFNSMHVNPDKDKKVYHIINSNGTYDVPAASMIVFPSFTLDGSNPLNVVSHRKRSISLAISYEERAEAYNINGAMPSGVVTWGAGYSKLSKEAQDRLEKKWEEIYQGVSASGGTAFMPEGSEFKPVSFDPEALQMLGSREFSIQEVARWFGVKPHKLADLSRATFSNIEHLSIEHVQDTILPRARKSESILTIALIPEGKRAEYFIEYNLDGLQRGDFASRMQAYAVGKQWGWLSTNEIRALENMNPVPDDQGGDEYLVPLNMIPASSLSETNISVNNPNADRNDHDHKNVKIRGAVFDRTKYLRYRAAATVRRQITSAYKPAFERSENGILKQEIGPVREAADKYLPKNLPGFLQFLDGFYNNEEFGKTVKAGVEGVISDYAGQISNAAVEEIGAELDQDQLSSTVTSYIENLVIRHLSSSKNQLRQIARDGSSDEERNSFDDVNQRLDEWSEKRAGKFRDNEPIRAEGAFSKAAWSLVGVQKIVWVTFGKSCPYCTQLDGKIIEMTGYFLGKGESVDVDGKESIITSGKIGHPQLHQGCDCGIAAVI